MNISELIELLKKMDLEQKVDVDISDKMTFSIGLNKKEQSLVDAVYVDNEPSMHDWLEILIRDYDIKEVHSACTCDSCASGREVSFIPKYELDDFFREYNLGERCDIAQLNEYLKDMNYVARTCLETNILPWEVEISKI